MNSSGPANDETGTQPVSQQERNGHTPHLNRKPWGTADLAGAVALSITANGVVVFAGAVTDAVLDGSPPQSIPGYIAAAAISLALSMLVVRITRLPLPATVNLLGLATLANLAVHVASDGGESDLLGIPSGYIEAAILSGVPFGVAWLYVSRKHGRSLRELGFVAPRSQTAYLLAAGAWFAAAIGVGLWSQLVTNIDTISPPDNTTPALEIAGGSIALALLLVALWGPVVEEIFFRGFLLGGLQARIGAWPAILFSSGVFALFHLLPGLYVPTFLLGVAFGWVYLKTRSIWPAIFAHSLHNTLALVVVWQEIGKPAT